MKLLKLWDSDSYRAYMLQNSFKENEHGFYNAAYNYSYDEYKKYIADAKSHSLGINLKEGYVPDTIYILVNDDDQYVGTFNLRHYLNDFVKQGPGHICYAISKRYRNMGYGTIGLSLLLKEAKKLGISEVYMSAYKDNKPSIKVQINNGAYIDHEDDKHVYTRIKL